LKNQEKGCQVLIYLLINLKQEDNIKNSKQRKGLKKLMLLLILQNNQKKALTIKIQKKKKIKNIKKEISLNLF